MANEAKLCTFISIFGEEFIYETKDAGGQLQKKSILLERIVIPKIQRDYAQGRKNIDIDRIREKFLNALLDAVIDENSKPITLDFVYGDINDEGEDKGVMIPLDGQQRLTTLFLLHWYAAKKVGLKYDDSEYKFLENFSYATRPSAREFCKHMVLEFNPTFGNKLSSEIEDQAWFPLHWKHDSTIRSMLVMLDAIDEKFSTVKNLWSRLKDDKKRISFYVLPIKDMGLTDDLYIKMNSRGKPLTTFEHFKAELEHELSEIDPKIAIDIISKFDIDWTNLLWDPKNPDIADNKFLNYFRFICDIIRYRNGDTPANSNDDEFSLITSLFSSNNPNETKSNIAFFDRCFDIWSKMQNEDNINKFFKDIISIDKHEDGKILVGNKSITNYFKDCLDNYTSSDGKRIYNLRDIIILYSFVIYLLNRKNISDKEFRRRIRIIHNLVNNSLFEISDTVGRNRMPMILKQVDSIMICGKILDEGFNKNQRDEEENKLTWTEKNPTLAESLFGLEDHELLYGQVDIIASNDPSEEYLNARYFKKFEALFNLDYDLIDRALMSIGDYKQHYRTLYQLGTFGHTRNAGDSSWKSLFHHSASVGFDNTRKCLRELLSSDDITETYLNDLISKYIKSCEHLKQFDWRYYYIKCNDRVFRPGRYGKYFWNDFDHNPYEFIVLWTPERISWNAYNPFLKAVELKIANPRLTISREYNGTRLIFDNKYIESANGAYLIKDINTNKAVEPPVKIAQNPKGIDAENRIEKITTHLKRKYNL